MDFHYQAKSKLGEVVNGNIEAASLAEARQALRNLGLFVLTLKQGARKSSTSRPLQNNAGWFANNHVSKADLLMMNTQLTIMCQSGIDLAEAIQNVGQQTKQPILRKTLLSIYQDVSDGASFSQALFKHEQIFGGTYIASIAAGEASGTLVKILKRQTELLKNEIRLRSVLRSVLSYPAVLLSVASIVVFALIFFVLPQFAIVFRDLGKTPPPLTQMILSVGTMLRTNMMIISGVVSILLIGGIRFAMTTRGKAIRDKILLNTYLLKSATRPLLTGRTFRLLGTMLQSGIPLLEAIRLCRSSIKNLLFQRLYDVLEKDILNGKGIGQALMRFEFIPAGAAQMIMTAEKTGNLGEISESIGEYYEESGEEQIRQLSKVLEPIIIVIMGVIVAFVMLTIMLPLLDVSSAH